MARKNGSNGQRLAKLEQRVDKLEQNVKYLNQRTDKNENNIDRLTENNIINDLQAKRKFEPNKYEYTQEAVAIKNDVPLAKVKKIVKKYGLTRKNKDVN